MKLVGLYALTALGFFAIDFVWLMVIATSFYDRHLGHLLRPEPVVAAAVAFYLLFLVGVLVFAVMPALADASLLKAVGLGALLGLVAYATFDLTCLALFVDFPVVVVVVDLVWGSTLTAVTAAIGYGAGRWLGL